MSVQQQDSDGVWRQSIPLPFYTSRFTIWWPFLIPAFKCMQCSTVFDTEQGYRDHYRSDHPE